jgi:hypothetical protein
MRATTAFIAEKGLELRATMPGATDNAVVLEMMQLWQLSTDPLEREAYKQVMAWKTDKQGNKGKTLANIIGKYQQQHSSNLISGNASG